MPKVKSLIEEYNWEKATGFEDFKPLVSVILPTYCRAESGLFYRTVQTLLEQNFHSIELIIIDDCSSDGTQNIIKKFM